MINELIEQIGGRERLESLVHLDGMGCVIYRSGEVAAMARALLAVLDAKPDFYIHRIEVCDTYGPEVELRAFNCQLDASKCRDDRGGEVIKAFTSPPAAIAPDEWKLVPLEPTQRMIDAHIEGMVSGGATRAYLAMIAAAPAPGDEK